MFSCTKWLLLTLLVVCALGLDEKDDESDEDDKLARNIHLFESALHETMYFMLQEFGVELARNATKLGISDPCSAWLNLLIDKLHEWDNWALQSLDMMAKFPAGIFVATVTEMGDFDSCLNTKLIMNGVEDTMQYCAIDADPLDLPRIVEGRKVESMHDLLGVDYFSRLMIVASGIPGLYFRNGACLPTKCTTPDVHKMANFIANLIGTKAQVTFCQTKSTPQPPLIDYFALWALVVTFSFVLFCTIFDTSVGFGCFAFMKKPKFKLYLYVLRSFSFFSNTKKLFSINMKEGYPCLHGIRFISITWVIVGHCYYYYMTFHFKKFGSMSNSIWMSSNIFFLPIANATFSVDTFFFLSGLLLVFAAWKLMDKTKGQMYIGVFIIGRLWRFLPMYSAILAATIALPLVGSGPLWQDSVGQMHDACVKYWWTNLLFINTYWYQDQICLPHSWFLSAGMQLYVVCLFFVGIWYRNPKVGIFINFLLCAVGAIITASWTVLNDYPPAIVPDGMKGEFTFQSIVFAYTWPTVHLGSHGVGMLVGYLLTKYGKVKVAWYINILLWLVSAAIGISVIYGPYKMFQGFQELPGLTGTIFYSAFSRTCWAIALAWPTYACCIGQGGVINKILSWNAFIPISRLTYAVYLTHLIVLAFHTGMIRHRLTYNHWEITVMTLAITVLSYLMAYLFSMCTEAPFLVLQNIIISKYDPEAKPKKTSLVRKLSIAARSQYYA